MKTASILRFVPALAIALGVHATAAHATPAFSKTVTKTDSFGTSKWAAGYTGTASLSYDKGALVSSTDDKLRASGSLVGWARMFGTKKELVEVRAGAYGAGNDPVTFGVDVYISLPIVGEIQLYTRDWDTSFSSSKSWSQTFFSVSQWVWAGPVPVHVSAKAKGTFGFNATATLSVAGLDATFTPRVSAYAKATAAVDVLFASAGIYGNLNLLTARLPMVASSYRMDDAACEHGLAATWDLDVDLELDSLDGELGVFAKLGGDRWEKELVEWNGYSTLIGLYQDSGAVCL